MVEIYVHDENDSVDFRQPHNSGKTVALEDLGKIGVIYKHIADQADVDILAKERNYKNRDIVTINVDTFKGDKNALEKQLGIFYKEHLHEDEEIRYCIEGSGYFDVRNGKDDVWVRCKVCPGDLLILPAGIYHRFTLTETNHIKALRLFKDEPKWQAYNRPDADSLPVRHEYLQSI